MGFWDRKRQEYQGQHPGAAPSRPSDAPWWAAGTQLLPVPAPAASEPQRGSQSDGTIDGHDISRVAFLKGKAEECPYCPRDPKTGVRGNMYKPSPSAAMRCFDCGHVEGRDIHDMSLPTSAIMEGPVMSARQVDQGGFRGASGLVRKLIN